VPKIVRRRIKLHRNQITFGRRLRFSCYASNFPATGQFMLDLELGIHRKISRGADHGTMNVYSYSKSIQLDRFAPQFQMEHHGDANHNALAAAPFIGCKRTAPTGRGLICAWHDRGLLWVHRVAQSSSPQKSISGSISSMPYSHPSTRSFPFQTITAGLERWLARLKTSSCCSTENSLGITARQP